MAEGLLKRAIKRVTQPSRGEEVKAGLLTVRERKELDRQRRLEAKGEELARMRARETLLPGRRPLTGLGAADVVGNVYSPFNAASMLAQGLLAGPVFTGDVARGRVDLQDPATTTEAMGHGLTAMSGGLLAPAGGVALGSGPLRGTKPTTRFLYSALERAIEDAPMKKATPQQWKAQLWQDARTDKRRVPTGHIDEDGKRVGEWVTNKNGKLVPGHKIEEVQVPQSPAPGLRMEEIERVGFPEFLGGRNTPITKQEMLDHFRANRVVVKEAQLGPPEPRRKGLIGPEPDPPYQRPARYGTYTHRGPKRDNREILLKVEGRTPDETYTGSHYGSEEEVGLNETMRIRFNDRRTMDGKKVVFGEEYQTDIHGARGARQEVWRGTPPNRRKEMLGYRKPDSDPAVRSIKAAYGQAQDAYKRAEEAAVDFLHGPKALEQFQRYYGGTPTRGNADIGLEYVARSDWGKEPLHAASIRKLRDRLRATSLAHDVQRNAYEETQAGMADLPYKQSRDSAMVGLKRMAQWAIDHGQDYVAWTPAWMQHVRYPGMSTKQMRGHEEYYDKIMPNVASELAKRYGAEVVEIEIPQAPKRNFSVKEVPIASVLPGLPDPVQRSFNYRSTSGRSYQAAPTREFVIVDDGHGLVVSRHATNREAADAVQQLRAASRDPAKVKAIKITPAMKKKVKEDGGFSMFVRGLPVSEAGEEPSRLPSGGLLGRGRQEAPAKKGPGLLGR